MSHEISVLLVCKDLFFTSQLHGAAQRAGLTARTCLSVQGCLDQLQSAPAGVVVVDLELPQLNLQELRAAAGDDRRIVAFGPHVRADLLTAAQQAGCDVVLTRGQAASHLEDLFRQFSAEHAAPHAPHPASPEGGQRE